MQLFIYSYIYTYIHVYTHAPVPDDKPSPSLALPIGEVDQTYERSCPGEVG